MQGRLLASGPGWRVADLICTAGPGDPAFEERHESVCVAVVTEGTFQYRSELGVGVLAPGALLLGNQGTCFECGHEHAIGDRCLSFHYEPGYFEEIVSAVPGARRAAFSAPSLPPLEALLPLVVAAEAARAGDAAELEEIALRLAGAAIGMLAEAKRPARWRSRDERIATDALRRIETAADEPVALSDLAREAGMSPYHFLRTFRAVAGVTPYQFALRVRVRRAAARLRSTDDPVATIAFESGFGDLSTFNHRFRRVMGATPSAYRKLHRARGGRLAPCEAVMPPKFSGDG